MKYIKTYELLNREPKIGDYVICAEYGWFLSANKILKNQIGRIVGKNCRWYNMTDPVDYVVKYNNYVGKELYFVNDIPYCYKNTIGFNRNNIIHYS